MESVTKPNILFVYHMKSEHNWRDGLWAALKLLEKDMDIYYWNMALEPKLPIPIDDFDFVLGWSSFEGEISHLMRNLKNPHGLAIGGYTFEPHNINHYDVLFYETEWYANAELKHRHKNTVHAFGVNTDIFKSNARVTGSYGHEGYTVDRTIVFDYLTIGSFSIWKNQVKILEKEGTRMAVGYIQEGNMDESFDIISQLLAYGCGVMGETSPEHLAKIINSSRVVYLPATISGGGERSVLEARACGVKVEVADDNPKLQELLKSEVWDHKYYYRQLKKGIESCLKK